MKEFEKATLAEWPKKLPVAQLQKTFGTPTWIVSEEQLVANVKALEKFTQDASLIYYPVKTNPSLTVLQILARLGVGADCASSSEIELALYAGIKIQNISYNTPAQDVELCKRMLKSGASVVMDDVDALTELQHAMQGEAFVGKLLLRLNLLEPLNYSHENENQELMAHGSKSSKFGIPVENLESILETIEIPIVGLHVHVGTQMDNLESFEFAIKELNRIADRLKALGHQITDINIGGGLGIPFSSGDTFPSLAHWTDALMHLKKDYYRYCIEPGHALVGNTVVLLTKILTIKKSRGKKWAILDVGTDQLAKITLLRWPHRILDESGIDLQKGGDAIAGPLCFAGDTLLDNVSVDGLKKGSALLVTEAGAYTYSMTNKFNGRLGPKWVLLTSDNQFVHAMDSETSFDNPQLLNYEWSAYSSDKNEVQLNNGDVISLSSTHLRETINDDEYSYSNVRRLSDNEYEFEVLTHSKVNFISMPLAIRIFGDAGIIAILHRNGYSQKEFSLWGRKLSLDCFGLIKSNRPLKFTLSLSDEILTESTKTLIVRFKTSCGKCMGSFVGIY